MNELNIEICQTAGQITVNFDEIKEELSSRMNLYKDAKYSVDTVTYAKKEVAALRKLKNAIDDRRKEVKKQQMQPYAEFEKRCKELTGLIDEPINLIANQIEAFEEKEKKEKLKKINDLFNSYDLSGIEEFVTFESIFDPKWLNKTFKMSSIEDAMSDFISKVTVDVRQIKMTESPDMESALNLYKTTYDLGKALGLIEERRKIREDTLKREQEQEARRREEEIRRQEREKLEAERRAELEAERIRQAAEAEKQAAVERAKAEAVEALIPEDSVDDVPVMYDYTIILTQDAKEKFEMYLDSVGIEYFLN